MHRARRMFTTRIKPAGVIRMDEDRIVQTKKSEHAKETSTVEFTEWKALAPGDTIELRLICNVLAVADNLPSGPKLVVKALSGVIGISPNVDKFKIVKLPRKKG